MDLLGGYYSNSSDESDEDVVMASLQAPQPTPSLQPFNLLKTRSERSSSSSHHAVVSERGRKLVSLHAVLPQHILDQLIKSDNKGLDDDDDESESEEDRNRKYNTSKDRPSQEQQSRQPPPAVRDVGISSFLLELHSAATTVTTTRASKGESETKLPISKIVHSLDATEFQSSPGLLSTMPNETQTPRIVNEPTVSSKIIFKRSGIVSAPQIKGNSATAKSLTSSTSDQCVSSATIIQDDRSEPYYATPAQSSSLPISSPTATASSQSYNNNKRSRRAMEQALRLGNFAALGPGTGDNSDDVSMPPMVSLEAPPPDSYQPPSEDRVASAITHGVRVVPVKMYNPKAGTDVTSVGGGGKQRSKHQITQLMVSAAALEQQRARGEGANSRAGTTHRADAKRKYGW